MNVFGNFDNEKIMKFSFWGCVVTVGYCGLNLYCDATLPCFLSDYWSSVIFWICLFIGWGISGFLWEDWARWANAILCICMILGILNMQGITRGMTTIEYTVEKKDTVYKIATEIAGCSVNELISLNKLNKKNPILRTGQKLKLPCKLNN